MAIDSIFLVHYCPPIYAQFLAPPLRTETTAEEPRPTPSLDLQRHLKGNGVATLAQNKIFPAKQ
jgi:hypothetical protein